MIAPKQDGKVMADPTRTKRRVPPRWEEQSVADKGVAEKLAVEARSPADYQRFGLSPTSIAPWEDGARTDDSAGTYEWWYFDAPLADGAKLVVTFRKKGT